MWRSSSPERQEIATFRLRNHRSPLRNNCCRIERFLIVPERTAIVHRTPVNDRFRPPTSSLPHDFPRGRFEPREWPMPNGWAAWDNCSVPRPGKDCLHDRRCDAFDRCRRACTPLIGSLHSARAPLRSPLIRTESGSLLPRPGPFRPRPPTVPPSGVSA